MLDVRHDSSGCTLAWPDGGELVVSAAWLRHSCRCAECVHPNGQRLIDMAVLARDARIDSVSAEGASIRAVVGGHLVELPATAVEELRRPPQSLSTWGAAHATALREQATDLARAETDLAPFFAQMATHGIALASGLGSSEGAVLDFAARLGFVRSTNYGDLFDVRSVADPNNLAYSSLGLPLHTDNPYRDPVPTVQILHCLENSATGGDSMFADGFAAAARLRDDHPDAFDLLRSVPVDFRFADADADLRARKPVLEVEPDGSLSGVRVNNRSMLPVSAPAGFYDALAVFVDLLNDAQHVLHIRLTAGDVIAFDNRRVLHARTAFQSDGDRHLQGCYIDIDAIRSAALVTSR